MRYPGSHHEIARRWLLEHAPHRVDVVAGESPVTLRLEVATERSDIAAEQLLRAPVERDSLTVTLPGLGLKPNRAVLKDTVVKE